MSLVMGGGTATTVPGVSVRECRSESYCFYCRDAHPLLSRQCKMYLLEQDIFHLANTQFISIGSARRQLNFRRQKYGGVKTYSSSIRPKSLAAPSQPSQEAAAFCPSESVSKVTLHNSFSVLETLSDTHSGEPSTDDNSQTLAKGVHVVEVHAAICSPKRKFKSPKLLQRCLRGSSEALDSISVDSIIVSSQFHQKRSRGSDESLDSTEVPPRKLPSGLSEGSEVNVDATDVVTSKDSISLSLEQRNDSTTCIIDVDVSACASDTTAVQDNTNVIISKNILAHIPSSSSNISDASRTHLRVPITAPSTTPRDRSSSSGPGLDKSYRLSKPSGRGGSGKYLRQGHHGGSAIQVRRCIPCTGLELDTRLQAVAVKVFMDRPYIMCSKYLPPSVTVQRGDLNRLVRDVPSPFILLGDFNGRHPLLGDSSVNPRGVFFASFIEDEGLGVLNTGDVTHFNSPTGTFTTIDISLCSPSALLDFIWRVLSDLYGCDHFPVRLEGNRYEPQSRLPRWKLEKADGQCFRELTSSVSSVADFGGSDEAVTYFTDMLHSAALISIQKPSGYFPKRPVPWWSPVCTTAVRQKYAAISPLSCNREEPNSCRGFPMGKSSG
ncbi:hypothetical protein Pcinc_003805 [Petrolisthes cinctipes]|uniref:Endonuclease/exonuclease/phosphatase domain-containing protein n=1 Tax=Petrolisthes cinctipes TaxID=88211 RepID=A0AAE1GIG0_PETCI|nr:hypothetical protein Pcinc_003805 [Petrolisthes cinctipes]